MTSSWGRFTARGGEAVERRIGEIVGEVGGAVLRILPTRARFALILIGGYGRGEGGIERVAGEERPHNNLDFLLAHGANVIGPNQKQQLRESIAKLAQEAQVGIDVSFLELKQLRRAAPLVMWYDTQFGHKTILGERDLIPSLLRFEATEILASDVRNLIVNRGTLLLINDLVLEKGSWLESDRRLVVRHAVKAIIGFGDALLFRWGRYHWSYVEKQKRMREQSQMPEAFRQLYEAAAEFRFEPNYDHYRALDLAVWMNQLRDQLSPLHLEFEAWRLRSPALAWKTYAETAFRDVLFERATQPRPWARKALNWWRCSNRPEFLTAQAGLGFRCGGERERLAVAFPLIAYDSSGPEHGPDNAADLIRQGRAPGRLQQARAILNADEPSDPRLVYLQKWAAHGDTNAASVLRKIGAMGRSESKL